MSKMIRNRKFLIPAAGMIIAVASIWTACHDEMKDETYQTSNVLMIHSYILEKDPSMSMFLDIGKKVNFSGTLQMYGKYTCFIPTNDAVTKYLQSIGKSSLDDLTEEECFTIMRYHIISMPNGVDSLTTVSFEDGRLPVPNMMAKYLTVRTVPYNGRVALELNRSAIILERDIRTGNGYINKIDQVLIPPSLTVGQQIMALPEKDYSLYQSVMTKTGWIDSLSRKADNGIWFTAFVQSNKTFASMGIENEDDLLDVLRIARYDIGGDQARNPVTMSKEDSLLWSFAAYQVVKSLNYVADLTRSSSLLTCSPNQIMTFHVKKEDVLINEYTDYTGVVIEPGAPVDRVSFYTDLSCYNGVLVEIGSNPARKDQYVGPVIRKPSAVYWDVCSQPEWKSHPNYMKSDIPHIDTRQMSEMWAYNADSIEVDASSLVYKYNQSQNDNKWQVVYHDYMQYKVKDFAFLDFKMPLLIEGEYNLWTCVRRDGEPIQVRVQFAVIQDNNGEIIVQELKAKDLYFQYADRVKTFADMVNYGAKRYVAKAKANESFALECGTFHIKSTGRHILRMRVVNLGTKGGNVESFLDMFQFIPADADPLTQYVWPRFDRVGKMIWPDTPCNEIFPYEQGGCNMGET